MGVDGTDLWLYCSATQTVTLKASSARPSPKSASRQLSFLHYYHHHQLCLHQHILAQAHCTQPNKQIDIGIKRDINTFMQNQTASINHSLPPNLWRDTSLSNQSNRYYIGLHSHLTIWPSWVSSSDNGITGHLSEPHHRQQHQQHVSVVSIAMTTLASTTASSTTTATTTFVSHSSSGGTVSQVTSGGMRNYSSYQELELLSGDWQIVLIIAYSLTAAIALVGNVIAIWVLMTGKRSSKELRLFLVNLSLADITMALFSIPFTYTDFMLGRWIFSPSFCPIVQLMQMTSVFVSVYTLIVIGIDRYIAIIYPLFSARYNRSFGSLTILLIWLAGFTLGSVQWANTQALPFYIQNEINYDCKEIWSSDQSQAFTFSVFIITFALPMSILMFVYGSVSYKMFRHSTPGNADLVRDRAQHNSRIKIIKMLATIVILFAICWLPLHILNLFIYFARDLMENIYNSTMGFNVYVTVAIVAHWFSMSNSFVNPIIYCFMSENFRSDLRFLLRKCCRDSSCYHKNALYQRRRSINSRMFALRSSQMTCHTSIFATSIRTTTSGNSTTSSTNSLSLTLNTANGYGPSSQPPPIPPIAQSAVCPQKAMEWSEPNWCLATAKTVDHQFGLCPHTIAAPLSATGSTASSARQLTLSVTASNAQQQQHGKCAATLGTTLALDPQVHTAPDTCDAIVASTTTAPMAPEAAAIGSGRSARITGPNMTSTEPVAPDSLCVCQSTDRLAAEHKCCQASYAHNCATALVPDPLDYELSKLASLLRPTNHDHSEPTDTDHDNDQSAVSASLRPLVITDSR